MRARVGSEGSPAVVVEDSALASGVAMNINKEEGMTTTGQTTFPSWVLDALDDNTRRKLILSYRLTIGRGIVVIAADMTEVELKTERDAELFLAGVSSAMTAFHDGEARDA